jgi:hypothetical protein
VRVSSADGLAITLIAPAGHRVVEGVSNDPAFARCME